MRLMKLMPYTTFESLFTVVHVLYMYIVKSIHFYVVEKLYALLSIIKE